MATAEKRKPARTVLVRCPTCNTPRTVSERHARRISAVCEDCSNPGRETLRLRNMRFWLSRYDDDEIAWMAAVIHDLPLRPDIVGTWRKRLMP